MANHYIGNCITPKIASSHIAKVTVPATGLKAGQCVIADTLDATIAGNYEVYVAKQPDADTLTSGNLAIVLNGGFEKLSDGRMPEGQPDYTQYTLKEGEIATVIYADEHLVFEISLDSVDGATTATPSNDIGKYLVAQAESNKLKVSATATAGAKSLKIIAIRNFPVGGMALGGTFGSGFVPTYICTAVKA